jgi:REP element-mobilizing transposase RayT
MGGTKRYPSSRLCEHARMTAYRRNFVAGGSFFFTVNLVERRLRLLTGHVDQLRTAFREVRRRHPFTIDAMVVLPDHLHTVWTMPEGDADLPRVGGSSNRRFRVASRPANGFPTAVPARANAASGSGAIGSIPFATRAISCVTSITSTSTPSNMGS